MNNIKFLRKKKGLTQAQLCKVLNIAQPTLSGYETGNYEPDQDTLGRIADYFGVTVDFILGRENHTTIDTTRRAVQITR